MSYGHYTVTAPSSSAMSSMASSTTAVAQTSPVSVGGSGNNVVDHGIIATVVGPATMTGSATTVVNFFVYASPDGSTFPGSSTTNEVISTSSSQSVTWSSNGNNAVFLGSVALTTTTSGTAITYYSKEFSLFAALGYVPQKYVIVAQNQAGAALTSVSFTISELYY